MGKRIPDKNSLSHLKTMQKITLYTKDNCPYCVLAKNLLTSLGAEYEEIDVNATPGLIMELVKKSGMRTVPQIYV
jgi:glutaredoxin 3